MHIVRTISFNLWKCNPKVVEAVVKLLKAFVNQQAENGEILCRAGGKLLCGGIVDLFRIEFLPDALNLSYVICKHSK